MSYMLTNWHYEIRQKNIHCIYFLGGHVFGMERSVMPGNMCMVVPDIYNL